MTDKLSYDIIGLVALIDRVKRAAKRYIRYENQIANTMVLSTEYDSNIVKISPGCYLSRGAIQWLDG